MEGWVCLQAVDRPRNVFRAWCLEVGRDLFGVLTLRVTFGRTGTDGRMVTKIASDEAQARETVRVMLARRRGAPRRVGVAYRLVEQVGLEGWDVPALLGVSR
jgi:predicted DNA-binding WGR domain protein